MSLDMVMLLYLVTRSAMLLQSKYMDTACKICSWI